MEKIEEPTLESNVLYTKQIRPHIISLQVIIIYLFKFHQNDIEELHQDIFTNKKKYLMLKGNFQQSLNSINEEGESVFNDLIKEIKLFKNDYEQTKKKFNDEFDAINFNLETLKQENEILVKRMNDCTLKITTCEKEIGMHLASLTVKDDQSIHI